MIHPISWSIALPHYAIAVAFGYLLGSIPFGLIITRLAGTTDIRRIGSGNIGATNVLRTGHKGLAVLTLAGDLLKGTLAVLLTYWQWGQDHAILAGLGAFLGHLFPVWLGFKGGKGVATYLGILLALSWQAACMVGIIWLVVAAITRYSSLAALVASVATPPLLWALDDRREAQLFALLTLLIWIMHRSNIARLLAGTEGKIGAHSSESRLQG